MLHTAFLIVLAILVAIGAIFAVDRDAFWERIFGPPDLGDVNFATLKPRGNPNEALACPKGVCPDYPRKLESPVFDETPESLIERLDRQLADESNVNRVDDGSNTLLRRYVTRSPLMRFPDTMSVEAFSLPEGRSTIAIYARAQLGKSDMGENFKRIRRWLALLEEGRTTG